MSIRIGIFGYGNLGRGVECALRQNADMELKAVFTRRNPETVRILTEGVPVYHADKAAEMKDEIDVMILCGGSATDLPVQTPALAQIFNVEYKCRAAILCTGTYLNATVHTGDICYHSGPDSLMHASFLTDALLREGISMMRFKTGTPARIHADSIDYSKLEIQEGESGSFPFSWQTSEENYPIKEQVPCYIAYTNLNTHEIIKNNLKRSAMYSGNIHGTGPRYCPSIEDKIVRFADKERHQLFLEPTGADTKEMYLQGFSTSMPIDVQMEMLHSLSGFENAKVMRYAYAIEYDCTDPQELLATLEYKKISGLYGAGQFNGTSGYEEAAAQGLVAGINAALKIKGREPMILPRSSSYIGTLIDDLVTKGTHEP